MIDVDAEHAALEAALGRRGAGAASPGAPATARELCHYRLDAARVRADGALARRARERRARDDAEIR